MCTSALLTLTLQASLGIDPHLDLDDNFGGDLKGRVHVHASATMAKKAAKMEARVAVEARVRVAAETEARVAAEAKDAAVTTIEVKPVPVLAPAIAPAPPAVTVTTPESQPQFQP